MEPYVDSDGLYNEDKDPGRKAEGRSKAMKGRIQTGLPDFLEGSKCHIPACPSSIDFRHPMYIPTKMSTVDHIKSVTHMIIIVGSG